MIINMLGIVSAAAAEVRTLICDRMLQSQTCPLCPPSSVSLWTSGCVVAALRHTASHLNGSISALLLLIFITQDCAPCRFLRKHRVIQTNLSRVCLCVRPIETCREKHTQMIHNTLHTTHDTRHITHYILNITYYTLHTTHYALCTTHYALHTTHYILHTKHYALHTTHYILHTKHYTLHTTHYILHTKHYTLHTTYYTLHTTHYKKYKKSYIFYCDTFILKSKLFPFTFIHLILKI